MKQTPLLEGIKNAFLMYIPLTKPETGRERLFFCTINYSGI